MSFPSYSEYKDSGMEWLGEVPAHWDVQRLKRVCKVYPSNVDKKSYEGEQAVRLCNYTDVYYNEIISVDMPFMEATATNEQLEKFALRGGDTIITKDSETADDIAISAYVPTDLPRVVCGYHLSIIRPKPDVDGRFIKRFFDSIYAKGCFEVAANGLTRVGLSQYAIENVVLPFPPKEEQHFIVSFLDKETAKIDALVAEQEKLIALLKEKRQAVISHAVTKGLNPNAPMKDSGIEWLGKVPAHWDVARIKWVAKMESGHTPDKKVEAYWTDCEIPWVSLNDTGYLKDHDYISETAHRINNLGIANSSARLLPSAVVVFSRDATIGRCAITTRQMAVSQHFIAWVCSERMRPEFLLRVLRSLTQELERLTFGATVKTIGMPDVRTLVTSVPPIAEQDQIILHIRTAIGQFDSAIQDAEALVLILRERRSALISAAVTGKIDVRGLASSAPVSTEVACA